MTDNPLPTPRYRIEICARAQTWDDLLRVIREIERNMRMRYPGPASVVSGGGWHFTVTEPDPTQTPERWHDELMAWCETHRSPEEDR